MNTKSLKKWLADTAWDVKYWDNVFKTAKALNSDGCTKSLDIFVWCCWEHDIHWQTGKYLTGEPITFRQSNYVFRQRYQQVKLKSNKPLTWLKYPISFTRWIAVSTVGYLTWRNYRNEEL